MHRLIAVMAMLVHMVFVAFTVIGGFLAWLIPGLLIPHVVVAAWGGRQAVTRAECPLSVLEDWGRRGSGRPRLKQGGFIRHYFEGRLYPATWARRIEVFAGTLVIGSWLAIALR